MSKSNNRVLRLAVPFVGGLFFYVMIVVLSMFREPVGFAWYGLLFDLVAMYSISEVNLLIAKRLKRKSDSRNSIQFLLKRSLLGLSAGTFIFLVLYLILKSSEIIFLNANDTIGPPHIIVTLGIGLLISFVVLAFQIGYESIMNWQQKTLEAEQLKKENLEISLTSLKNQIDPHFLFNNLNTLQALINEDKAAANEFLIQLSDTYRYLLDSGKEDIISINQELNIIHKYVSILKHRHGDNLQVTIDPQITENEYQIVPLTLQMALENVFKHNIVNSDYPMRVDFKVDSDTKQLVIQNNINPEPSNKDSLGIGIENLKGRYELLGYKDFGVEKNEKQFTLRIPLIQIVSYASTGG
ncbi:MAG: histidine kinase [bacterium]|nr:histidine kinase [bacterium]